MILNTWHFLAPKHLKMSQIKYSNLGMRASPTKLNIKFMTGGLPPPLRFYMREQRVIALSRKRSGKPTVEAPVNFTAMPRKRC